MDIPYDKPATPYGVGGAQAAVPGASAAEVTATAQRAAGTMGGAPAAPAAGNVPFYNRPIAVPSWLKTAGGFGVRVMGPLGAAAGLTPIVKSAFENYAKAWTGGEGSSMAPDPAKPAATATAPAAAAPVADPALVGPDQETTGAANLRTANAAGFGAQSVGETALATGLTPRGTGGVRNEKTGRVTGITPAGFGARAADPNASVGPGAVYDNASAAGVMVGGGMRLKQIAGDNALHMAGAKLMLDQVVKGAEAQKNQAQAGNFGMRTTAAIEHLRANPGDYAAAGAIAAGRQPAAKNVFLPTMSADKVDVGNTGTGKINRVTVPAQVTESDIQKTMASNKLTREQVMKRLRDEGRM